MTRLSGRVKELESKVDQPTTIDVARRTKDKLESLDSEFKMHHFAVIDVIDEKDATALGKEQDILDEHDDEVSALTVRLQKLITTCTSIADPDVRKIPSRKLTRLEKNLTSMNDQIKALTSDSGDSCLIHQFEEQVSDLKKELSSVRDSLLSLDLDDSDELSLSLAKLEKMLFDCSLDLKRLLKSRVSESSACDSKGVKLPKLDVPTFNGNILNWKSFWEQFCVSVHDRTNLSTSEKLVYLQHALKDGSAKHTIEGLSRSGEYYAEAVECLKSRYDRPRLIHQTHVRMILEAPSLKEGTGKELRRLHDTVQQHLRALKAMDHEPPGPFVTSVLELKLDTNTMFEWQKHSQISVDVPHYKELLEFINLRAQASETSTSDQNKKSSKGETQPNRKLFTSGKPVVSFAANTTDPMGNCVLCKTDKHPLYVCPKFKNQPHDKMIATLKANDLCMNCLRPGHYVKQCRSLHRCRKCQKPHHTLLHVQEPPPPPPSAPATDLAINSVPVHTATGVASNSLLMTCRILVDAPDGTSVEARALLDCASSASFISERLAQSLCLPRSSQNVRISGVAGLSHGSPSQSITNFSVSSRPPGKKISVTAIIVQRVTCDLPLHPVPFNADWKHLTDLQLADPTFRQPGRIDILLGVDVFTQVLLQGRRIGSPGSPVAFETVFGWVLAGSGASCYPAAHVTSCHTSLLSGDDLLQKFWETEESPTSKPSLTPEERSVVQHFQTNHYRDESGRFVVPLPRRPDAKPLGESRSQAVRRFLSLEHSLHCKGQFADFNVVMQEYFDLKHAENVPLADLNKPPENVFYLPMHAVRKESSTTTKIRAVFDASAKSSTGTSLNDTLLVGPTIHPPLVDVLLRFRLHRVALTADVSRMYRAVMLTESDRDFHRFVWRQNPNEPLQDYRMTRVTFGVSASSFAANMSVKQNALNFTLQYPLAAKIVEDSFYVDDTLTGADSIKEAVERQTQLQGLFSQAGFLLRKWNSSESSVLQHIPPDLLDSNSTYIVSDPEEYTKTLGLEWNTSMDHFRLTVADFPPLEKVTKRLLVSDIAKTFDVLGWFAPTLVKAKILLQRLWEQKVDWDDPVPQAIREAWLQWRCELRLLVSKTIPRCYFPKSVQVTSFQLHGFCDASELAYAGVVYLRMVDSEENVHIALVTSKTKVAPIKRLTIPRLELCGAQLLAQLLFHVREALHIPIQDVHAWTDSTIVLSWLEGNPRRFKTYVGNRVSCIVELVAPSQWNHVNGAENPADCASRGLFPSELLGHELWWSGPEWLRFTPAHWPKQVPFQPREGSEEEKEICLLATAVPISPLLSIDRYSSFTKLKRVTAWTLRFVNNCRSHKRDQNRVTSPLTVEELTMAETYWLSISQQEYFAEEIDAIQRKITLPNSSYLLPLHPIVDSSGLLRVGGREQNSGAPYSSQHPIILHGKHPVSKLLIQSEHLRPLHAGPKLLTSSISRRFHIVGHRKIIRSITRGCVTCRRSSARPRPQMMGQLPIERVTPDSVFNRVGVDYAGPVYIKYGFVRKPTVIKAYVCIFVSLSVKAVHLELVSDLSTDAFIASLRRFVARRGKPILIWSDHGSNFVGAARELRELVQFLELQKTQNLISEFCSSQNIQWKMIPEHAPHFGGIWESAVKSMKTHLRRIVGTVKLTFEEFTTVLTQIESCLNSRPLTPLPCDDDGVEALTPGHFLIGRPLESIPDPAFSYRSMSLLRRWHLCQSLVRHFWQRWYTEYITILRKFTKWHHPSRNAQVGDVVIVKEDNLIPGKWPLARITEVHTGQDGLVRVATVKTANGTYKRPITKLALLLPCEN